MDLSRCLKEQRWHQYSVRTPLLLQTLCPQQLLCELSDRPDHLHYLEYVRKAAYIPGIRGKPLIACHKRHKIKGGSKRIPRKDVFCVETGDGDVHVSIPHVLR